MTCDTSKGREKHRSLEGTSDALLWLTLCTWHCAYKSLKPETSCALSVYIASCKCKHGAPAVTLKGLECGETAYVEGARLSVNTDRKMTTKPKAPNTHTHTHSLKHWSISESWHTSGIQTGSTVCCFRDYLSDLVIWHLLDSLVQFYKNYILIIYKRWH